MRTVNKIQWESANYLWDDFKVGNDYAQYLLDEFGIVVEVTGRVLWDKVFTVEVVVEPVKKGGGRPYDPEEDRKKEKRKIKLIFICGDNKGMIEKQVNKDISTQLLSDIRNKIEEITRAQIVLKDVQIIER